MLLAQLSDLHIEAREEPDAFIDTAACLRTAVTHLNGLDPHPDAVLITGDLVDTGSPADYALLRELLAPLPMPVYLQPGNHDDRAGLCRAFADHPYLPPPGEYIQYTVEDLPVRLVVLDTLIPGKVGGELCAARLDWLAARLAEQPERPTIVALHHPPFDTGIQAMDRIGLDAGRAEFAALIARHAQVERVLCGHLHRHIQRRWQGTLAGTCPSVAHALLLDLSDRGRLGSVLEPPAYQLHQWREPGGLVSYLDHIGQFSTRLVG